MFNMSEGWNYVCRWQKGWWLEHDVLDTTAGPCQDSLRDTFYGLSLSSHFKRSLGVYISGLWATHILMVAGR